MSVLLDDLRRSAAPLAGPADAFEHRARGYRALYRQGRGNDAFPLIAAFGALWARGFLRTAMRAGGALAVVEPRRAKRAARWARLTAFAGAFRALHQRVFVETVVLDRLVRNPALAGLAARTLPDALLSALRLADDAAHAGVATPVAERAALFDALFRWEQEQAVGARVLDAFAAVDWPLVEAVARRPMVRFGYFPAATTLRFGDFRSLDERIAQGRRAFDLADAAGWPQVAADLDAALARVHWTPAPQRAAACPLGAWLAAPVLA